MKFRSQCCNAPYYAAFSQDGGCVLFCTECSDTDDEQITIYLLPDDEGDPVEGDVLKYAAIVAGRAGGKRGGPARALALSPERRSAIASLAAKKRWEQKP